MSGEINFVNIKECLQNFDFKRLFVEELGWSLPSSKNAATFEAKGVSYTRREIAQLGGIPALEITASDGIIPDSKTRASVHGEISS
jgi:hypothetical protein